MPFGGLLTVGILGATGAIGGGLIAAHGASSAAKTQAQAAEDALGFQKEVYNNQLANAEPYLSLGATGETQMASALPGLLQGFDPASVGLPATFSYSDSDFKLDPGYNFALQQGEQAIEHGAAAGGNLGSGDTLKALNDYAQGMANQQYNTAYNRALNTYQQNYANGFNTFETNQGNQFNRLQALINTGLSANNQAASAGQNYANNAGNYTIGAGNAQAAGTVGAANAINSGITGATGSVANTLLLQQLLGQNSGRVLNAPTVTSNDAATLGLFS
jgi:hypothetical protein